MFSDTAEDDISYCKLYDGEYNVGHILNYCILERLEVMDLAGPSFIKFEIVREKWD